MVMSEGFIADEHLAIDATHFESREAAKSSLEKEPIQQKNTNVKRKKNLNNGFEKNKKLKPICPFIKKKLKHN
ncbi:hypothetical protein JFL43_22080 [Viridibacillus sp. YIM B01967]|uniref:Transposase n=1 Tax=Viridibacillus soli TaxID=2798301 RepID=A0ABS1HDB8_9BACL|nr:hypothetical protein [Viridibacillus soli]MBK3497446.1 hypothetical protein [Viridibacillus soli]